MPEVDNHMLAGAAGNNLSIPFGRSTTAQDQHRTSMDGKDADSGPSGGQPERESRAVAMSEPVSHGLNKLQAALQSRGEGLQLSSHPVSDLVCSTLSDGHISTRQRVLLAGVIYINRIPPHMVRIRFSGKL